MKQHIHKLFILPLVLFCSMSLHAQTGAGSSTADNSTIQIAAGTTELRFSEISYFGPNSAWEINGTLEIWSKKIWISPTAKFTGTGKIIIHDPSTNPYYDKMTAGPTQIDGNNGRFIETAIELRNPANLVLTDLADPGYASVNPSGALAAALNIGGLFDFAVDNADIILNGNDLGIAATGRFENYNSKRMIVTGNSVTGHVVKHFAGILPFHFPLGIAEGDYTPATLTPVSAAALHVSVINYSASQAAGLKAEKGMDRIWHIYADKGINVTHTLQHNIITNGNAYIDASAQIMQYAGTGKWVGGTTVVQSPGIHTREGVATGVDGLKDSSWFTKLNELVGPVAGDDGGTDKGVVISGNPIQINVLENDKPGSSPIVVASVRIVSWPKNGSVKVNTDGSITYISTPGYVGDDFFEYEITDENGLKATAKVYIKVVPRPLIIPNVFTPNGDGKNDVFEIVGLEGFERVNVRIINRWGNEVYKNPDYRNNWDGSNLNEGTYYYIIITKKDGKEQTYKGWVLIKR